MTSRSGSPTCLIKADQPGAPVKVDAAEGFVPSCNDRGQGHSQQTFIYSLNLGRDRISPNDWEPWPDALGSSVLVRLTHAPGRPYLRRIRSKP
jgi:hypothetical protein